MILWGVHEPCIRREWLQALTRFLLSRVLRNLLRSFPSIMNKTSASCTIPSPESSLMWSLPSFGGRSSDRRTRTTSSVRSSTLMCLMLECSISKDSYWPSYCSALRQRVLRDVNKNMPQAIRSPRKFGHPHIVDPTGIGRHRL